MSERLRRYAPRPGLSAANRKRESHKATHGHQTGAKTPEGKARSAARSRKHGAFGAEAYALRAWLQTIIRLVKSIRGGA
jgi:hypothetical protein